MAKPITYSKRDNEKKETRKTIRKEQKEGGA